eukprot:814873-Rhodomonas_salina.2
MCFLVLIHPIFLRLPYVLSDPDIFLSTYALPTVLTHAVCYPPTRYPVPAGPMLLRCLVLRGAMLLLPGGSDYGGLYRDSIREIAAELQCEPKNGVSIMLAAYCTMLFPYGLMILSYCMLLSPLPHAVSCDLPTRVLGDVRY